MFFARCKTRITALLMAFALFGAGLLVAFHHHEAEAKDAGHCATCHLGQQNQGGPLDSGSFHFSAPDFFPETLAPAFAPKLSIPDFLLGKFSQAPPMA